MKPYGKIIRRLDRSTRLGLALVITFTAMVFWGVLLVRDKMLQNAREMGTSLAQSYAEEEQSRIRLYKMLIYLGAKHLDVLVEEGREDEVDEWLAVYSEDLRDMLGVSVVTPYAVVDGKFVTSENWDGLEEYDHRDKGWYLEVMEEGQGTVFTDLYEDTATGNEIVTVARRTEAFGNVLAYDIRMDSFYEHKNQAQLPENSSFFLFDRTGGLLYSLTELDAPGEQVAQYTSELFGKVKRGELDSVQSAITDLDGKRRSVYSCEMDNGWTVVITIPMTTILHGDVDWIFLLLISVSILLMLAAAASAIRAFAGGEKLRRTSDTVMILGESYYGIYRVNYEQKTYETVKSAEDVRERMGESGPYERLLDMIGELVDPATNEEFRKNFSLENIQRLAEQGLGDFGGDYKRKFGDEYRWVNARMIYSRSLETNEVILCFREVEKEKQDQLNQKILLESALESAQKSVRERSLFFSSVSHDMRTPLNAIIGLSELALNHWEDREQTAEYLKKIRRSGQQLLSLINDILDMARSEQAGRSMDYQAMDLKKWGEECTAMFVEKAREEGKELVTEVSLRDPMVYCDPIRLSQILNNLLSNAFKYSARGASVRVSILQLSDGERGKYEISVKDTGYGMSEEFLGKIFQPFTRETTFASIKTVGTGLGMSIVKNLVQQMDGEITVKSRLGEGSEFTVILPLTAVRGEEAQIQEAGKKEAADVGILNGKTVLVAEDNEINMEIAAEFLAMLGVRVIRAWNGKEAVEAFDGTDPGTVDAVLMDMQMPEMDGCEASRAIRSLNRPDGKTVPIVAVTANAFAEDMARTKAAGMNGHLSKPIDFGQLGQLLAEFIAEREKDQSRDEKS